MQVTVRSFQRQVCRLQQLYPARSFASGHFESIAAKLPKNVIPAGDALSTTQQVLHAARDGLQPPERIWADERAGHLLTSLADGCTDLDAQQLRTLLAAFAASQHMPQQLWPDIANELPRALTDLPDLHAVHC